MSQAYEFEVSHLFREIPKKESSCFSVPLQSAQVCKHHTFCHPCHCWHLRRYYHIYTQNEIECANLNQIDNTCSYRNHCKIKSAKCQKIITDILCLWGRCIYVRVCRYTGCTELQSFAYEGKGGYALVESWCQLGK